MTKVPDVAELLSLPTGKVRLVQRGDLKRWLLGKEMPLLAAVQGWVAEHDTERLRGLVLGSTALHDVLGASQYVRISGLSEAPFLVDEPPVVHAGRALGAMGMALVAERDEAVEYLEIASRWLDHSGLRTDGSASTDGLKLDARVAALLEHDLSQTMLLWLLWLAGGLPKTVGGPRMYVLLDRGSEGQVATLSLSVARRGQPCLVPDPRTMMLSSADEVFRTAEATAWAIAAQRIRGTVLWSVDDFNGPVPRIENSSASGALTVLLDEQRRRQRRLLRLVDPRRLRGHTAIVGRVEGGQPADLTSVGGYDAKLSAVADDLRVIVPTVDEQTAVEANRKYGHAQLLPVRTWREAARASRRIDRRWVGVWIAAALAVVLVITGVLLWGSESRRGQDRRTAVASDLAARAVGLRQTDPQLSAKLALASYRLDHGNARAVDAMRSVLSDNQNVERSWQASPGFLSSVAVIGDRDRVITSGDDQKLKLWTLSTGKEIGSLNVGVGDLAPANTLQVVAADVGDAASGSRIQLFDVGGNQPVSLGLLPAPTCGKPLVHVVSLKFTAQDTKVVAVWDNGLVVSYDFLSRRQDTCFRLADAVNSIKSPGAFFDLRKVKDADLVSTDEDEVVALLDSRDVVSVGLSDHVVKSVLPADSYDGDPSIVAASAEALAVATDGGVLIWDRKRRSTIAFPAAGLAVPPKYLELQHGNLLIAGDTGTVVVPTAPGAGYAMEASFRVPHGGAASVGSMRERDIVVGGPGGRVVVLRATETARLNNRPAVSTAALRFRSAGDLVVADNFMTASQAHGVNVLDPRNIPASTSDIPADNEYNSRSFYINAVAGNDRFVAAAGLSGRGGIVLVWPTDHTLPREFVLPPPNDKNLPAEQRIMTEVGFVDDLGLLVARHISGEIGIWSTSTWKERTLKLKSGNPRMALGTSTALFAEGSEGSAQLVQVDLQTLKVMRRAAVPDLLDLEGTADGTRYVTSTYSGVLRVFDGDLKQVGRDWRVSSGSDGSDAISLSPDGRSVAVAQGSRVLVYDVDSHLLTMPALQVEPNQTVTDLDWSPDGSLLAGTVGLGRPGGMQLQPIAVWRMQGMDWPTQVCRWTGGGLSESDWKAYVGNRQPFQKTC